MTIEGKPQDLPPSERERIKSAIKKVLADEPAIAFAYVYGSFQEGIPFRDIDVGVYVKEDVDEWDFSFDLELKITDAIRALGYSIPVDVRVINRAPVGFRYHVYAGEPLVIREEDLHDRETVYVFSRYEDMKPLLIQALKEATER